jgi:hypothetical protein
MIRFIFDSFGDSHHDIFLKIDVGLTYDGVYITDFYFIPEFMEFESSIDDKVEWKKEYFKAYLEHLIDLINLNLDNTYLMFDLSNQYISAIKLEKFIRSKTICYKTSMVYSDNYYGWGVNYKMQQSEFIDSDWKKSDNQNWEITKDSVLKGIKWSIENLACKTPVIEWTK